MNHERAASETGLVTIEPDGARAEAARHLVASLPNVRVPRGDWHDVLAHGPFDLLFADGGDAKRREPEAVLEAMRPGQRVVLDDLRPEGSEPPERRGTPDPVRADGLNAPRMVATEAVVGPNMAVILATCVV